MVQFWSDYTVERVKLEEIIPFPWCVVCAGGRSKIVVVLDGRACILLVLSFRSVNTAVERERRDNARGRADPFASAILSVLPIAGHRFVTFSVIIVILFGMSAVWFVSVHKVRMKAERVA